MEFKMKRLSILGSTGSVGTQALEVIDGLNSFPVKVEVLAAHSNVKLLEEQIRKYKPLAAVLYDEDAAKDLKDRTRDLNLNILTGMEGLCEAAAYESVDITLNSVVGMIGLKPTLAAINAKKRLAIANKETLVCAGNLVMEAANRSGAEILPVDSEHSAVFQCLNSKGGKIKKIIITASGGPFFGKTIEELKNVKPEQALRHPNWDMGAKITIDSATMMNKGLEVIEASWLFDVTAEEIEVVVHRESIIHSMVEFEDNSIIAQLGVPDMKIPIQYALTYPDRFPSPVKSLSLSEIGKLTFFEPDYRNFKCLSLCIDALKRGGLAPAAANGANEVAVQMFLQGRIGFTDIADLVEAAMLNQINKPVMSLEDVLEADKKAREFVRQSL